MCPILVLTRDTFQGKMLNVLSKYLEYGAVEKNRNVASKPRNSGFQVSHATAFHTLMKQ